jgi:hypothetical protein
LLRARDDHNIAINALGLVDGEDLLAPILRQVLFQQKLLVQERRDYSDALGIDPAVLEVVNNHCTDGCFHEVFVLEALPFLQLQLQNDLVGPQKRDRTLFNFFKPREHRIYIPGKVNFLIGYLLVALDHHVVVND